MNETQAQPFPRAAAQRLRAVARGLIVRLGFAPGGQRFRGAFRSREAALAAVRAPRVGYDHPEVAPISFEEMCRLAPWDYPVLYWLRTWERDVASLIDAGGHMGTKHRAFMPLLRWEGRVAWTVYDLPAIVAAGEARAAADGVAGLRFVSETASLPPADLLLASGLLQYLDAPFADLVCALPRRPKFIIINKLAAWTGAPVFTLENFGVSEIVYQIRDGAAFEREIAALGYDIVDRWEIPSLSHAIRGEAGAVVSRSFGFALRDARAEAAAG